MNAQDVSATTTDNTCSPYKCALITGASSGIGEEYAIQLAPLCEQLVLVARRQDRLLALHSKLTTEFPNLSVIIHATDLSIEGERVRLFDYLQSHNIYPTLLVNNAGLGDYGEFMASQWDRVKSMLEVNMVALTHLTYLLAPHMQAQKCGAIINVSSIASLLPLPDFAVYAATKAYVTSFSEAIREELAEDNIPVLTVCPGPISTEFGAVAARKGVGFNDKHFEKLKVSKESVVRESLYALQAKKARLYPGLPVALLATFITIAPICLLRYINSQRLRRLPQESV